MAIRTARGARYAADRAGEAAGAAANEAAYQAAYSANAKVGWYAQAAWSDVMRLEMVANGVEWAQAAGDGIFLQQCQAVHERVLWNIGRFAQYARDARDEAQMEDAMEAKRRDMDLIEDRVTAAEARAKRALT